MKSLLLQIFCFSETMTVVEKTLKIVFLLYILLLLDAHLAQAGDDEAERILDVYDEIVTTLAQMGVAIR